MSKEKIITARKVYKCNYCGYPIWINQKYIFGKGCDPKYNDDDIQIGIDYHQYRIHLREDCKGEINE